VVQKFCEIAENLMNEKFRDNNFVIATFFHDYPRQKRPMGGAPYIGPKLGGGPIFQVSVSQLDVKERPG
jgi:hypothetical protein